MSVNLKHSVWSIFSVKLISTFLVLFLIAQANYAQKSDSSQVSLDSTKLSQEKIESSNKNYQEDNPFILWKDFYVPFIAVFFAWLLSFIPQKRQNIQQTFFELLKNQIDVLNRIDHNGLKGPAYFKQAKENLNYFYNFLTRGEMFVVNNEVRIKMSETSYTSNESMVKFFKEKPIKNKNQTEKEFQRELAEYIYVYFFEKNSIYVGHYFRHLFNMIKFVKRNRIWIINTKFYTRLIQAQMSAPELYVLFYNGLIFKEMEDFINNYSLIENLSINDLMNVEHFSFYDKCKMKMRPIYSWNKLGRD